jgi:carotenoid cleavage dioxygenase
MTQAAATDCYTHPGFVPVHDELAGVELRIEGELPAELDGIFLRNGANALFPPRRRHMFDGEAMVHMIELRGGAARYSNSIVRTPRTRYIEEVGRNPFLGVGDLTGGGKGALIRLIVERWKTRLGLIPRFAPIEAASGSTAILHHDDRLYCLQETGLPFRLDVARANDGWLRIDGTGSFEDFGGHLTFPFSAHPKTDKCSGAVHSLGHDIMSGTTRYTVVDVGGAARSATIMDGKPPPFFVHDYELTDDFMVFPDSSLRFDPARLARGNRSVANFDSLLPLRFGVVARDHRDGDPVRWFETAAPGHIWHIANGWQQHGAIHLYAPVFRDYPSSIPIHTPAEPHTEFVYWRLDLASGKVSEERVLLDHHYERPGIDWRHHGQPSRFTWLLDEGRGGVMGKGVLKYDLFEEREAGYIDYGALYGGEPVFVPRGDGADANGDRGWILDLLANGDEAALIVFDAATMVEQCRVHLPRRVPFGVHALWLDRVVTDLLQTV